MTGRLQMSNVNGLVKSPSAALRFNFVAAPHVQVRLTPQFLRALHCRGTLRVPDIGREASRPYN
jgi:hypothetical protein